MAVLVDFDGLADEARAQGGELAMRRLLAGLAGDRTVDRAVCWAARRQQVPAGFDLQEAEEGPAAGITFASLAIELAASAGQLVLAPASEPLRRLAAAMRRAGHRVELADFVASGDADLPVRRLGRDCLFVP
ncbi:MAG: hypothetical protein FJ265_18080 [Planctomycetes bacterium]|nr:hypothetical protein [Planctomycetota bacterium]